MDGATLQDRIARGLGSAARAIGVLCDAYRPSGTALPLADANRFLRLCAAFNARDPSFRSAALPGQAMWYGVFDSAYLQSGDYLSEIISGRVWFVCALQSLLPALCILSNRVLSVQRPAAGMAGVAGINGYGGGIAVRPIITGFPGSLVDGGAERGVQTIPADARLGNATVLLPLIGETVFARGDIVSDDLGRNYVVSQSEQSQFGWRLDVRQAAS